MGALPVVRNVRSMGASWPLVVPGSIWPARRRFESRAVAVGPARPGRRRCRRSASKLRQPARSPAVGAQRDFAGLAKRISIARAGAPQWEPSQANPQMASHARRSWPPTQGDRSVRTGQPGAGAAPAPDHAPGARRAPATTASSGWSFALQTAPDWAQGPGQDGTIGPRQAAVAGGGRKNKGIQTAAAGAVPGPSPGGSAGRRRLPGGDGHGLFAPGTGAAAGASWTSRSASVPCGSQVRRPVDRASRPHG